MDGPDLGEFLDGIFPNPLDGTFSDLLDGDAFLDDDNECLESGKVSAPSVPIPIPSDDDISSAVCEKKIKEEFQQVPKQNAKKRSRQGGDAIVPDEKKRCRGNKRKQGNLLAAPKQFQRANEHLFQLPAESASQSTEGRPSFYSLFEFGADQPQVIDHNTFMAMVTSQAQARNLHPQNMPVVNGNSSASSFDKNTVTALEDDWRRKSLMTQSKNHKETKTQSNKKTKKRKKKKMKQTSQQDHQPSLYPPHSMPVHPQCYQMQVQVPVMHPSIYYPVYNYQSVPVERPPENGVYLPGNLVHPKQTGEACYVNIAPRKTGHVVPGAMYGGICNEFKSLETKCIEFVSKVFCIEYKKHMHIYIL